MHTSVKVIATVGALRAVTPAQLIALRNNVLNHGLWDTTTELRMWLDQDFPYNEENPTGTLMVKPIKNDSALILIGIEKDGYTHS